MENSLSLFVAQSLIISGKSYEWTISETKYPNYDQTNFNTFILLSGANFKALTKKIAAIAKDLNSLGLDNNEIITAICEDHKVCF